MTFGPNPLLLQKYKVLPKVDDRNREGLNMSRYWTERKIGLQPIKGLLFIITLRSKVTLREFRKYELFN